MRIAQQQGGNGHGSYQLHRPSNRGAIRRYQRQQQTHRHKPRPGQQSLIQFRSKDGQQFFENMPQAVGKALRLVGHQLPARLRHLRRGDLRRYGQDKQAQQKQHRA